jgi:hypothetical protein
LPALEQNAVTLLIRSFLTFDFAYFASVDDIATPEMQELKGVVVSSNRNGWRNKVSHTQLNTLFGQIL